LRFNPLNGRATAVLARCRLEERRYDDARELFDAAAANHYDHTHAFNLGVLASRQEQWEQAAAAFTRSCRQLPSPGSLTALANVERARRRYAEAERLYRLALEADRGHHDAGYALARLVARTSLDEAVTVLRDNIAVIDARMAAGADGTEGALFLVKNLKTLVPLATKAGRGDVADEARRRLATYERRSEP